MSTSIPQRHGKYWTRDELILAFELYCRIPFRKTNTRNPQVQELAALLGRSPASVARKLGNFGSFDPNLRRQNISGLSHAGKSDREVWDDFHSDWNRLVFEAHKLKKNIAAQRRRPMEITLPTGPTERIRSVKQRVHQSFFRQAVLSSYNNTCCITGLTVSECLIASHIVPWSADERYRTDPSNGLCLSATFDRLFDAGLLTLTPDLTVELSRRLQKEDDRTTVALVGKYHKRRIILPERFAPSLEHLNWHRENVFER